MSSPSNSPSDPPPSEDAASKPKRVSRIMSLTDANVARLKPEGKRYRVTDKMNRGLSINVGVRGGKTWEIRLPARTGGRQTWIQIGSFGEVSSDEARKKAKEHWGTITSKPEALETLRAKKGAETLAQIVPRWLAYIAAERAEATHKSYKESMDLYILKVLGRRKLHQITPRLLRLWHRRMGRHGLKTVGDVALRTLSSFFRWAIANNKADTNPARDVPRRAGRVIHRPMSEEDRRKVGQTMKEMMQNGMGNPIYLKALQLKMATGLRRKSIAKMEWSHIDFERKFVRVRDKAFRIHGEKKHPLGPTAIAILRSVPRIGDSPWVFPGRDPMTHMALGTLNAVWNRVRTTAGVVAKDEEDRYGKIVKAPKPRLHDLRHTKGAILGAKNKNTMVAATMGISPEMANRYGTPHDEEVVQANMIAEAALGADLGIFPDLEGFSAAASTMPAPAPVQIVIQINWPYVAKTKPRKKAPKEPKVQQPVETKIDWPTAEELQRLVLEKPVRVLAKDLGVSDKAIEKRCRKLGLETRPRGYWAIERSKL